MNDSKIHVQDGIQAWLDGEVTGRQAREIENHCRTCEACGEIWREQLRVRELLGADTAIGSLAPMWPAVEGRLQGRFAPRFGFSFAVGTTAAAVAGIALGVLIGTVHTANTEQDIWSEIGSTMTAESGMAPDVYLQTTDDDGGGEQ